METEQPASGETVDTREPGSRDASAYLTLISDAETYFRKYHEKCDKIEEEYADLAEVVEATDDGDFKIFWANLEVLKPAIYARPPVPVVVPRFKNRKELPRRTSELLERAMSTLFELENIDDTMKCVRDDVAMTNRGVMWLRYERYETADGAQKESVKFEHVDRKDFLHEPARKWAEVPWVARRAFLTRAEGLQRFGPTSGNAFLQGEFKHRMEDDKSGLSDREAEYRGEQKAPVWEIWHKVEGKVIWVSPGVEEILDKQDPHLQLEGFWPCPKPAFGTLKPRSLKPVPDYIQYQGQIAQIKLTTARISALTEALRVRGFYQKGSEDVGDAIEAALNNDDDRAVLVPVSSFAATGDFSNAIVWWPVKDIALVIRELINARQQLIEDVYQITGLSDIMRGETEPNETLGAQRLKSQYGSVRLRDKQAEIARIARDATRIAAEIMAELFGIGTLIAMSQTEDLKTDAQIQQEIAGVQQRAQKVAADPQVAELAQNQPAEAQKLQAQIQKKIADLRETATVEKILTLLREQNIRPFVLDIETDSTIQIDEAQEKASRAEFVGTVGKFVQQSLPVVQAFPPAGPLFAEVLKFMMAPYRAGRELEGNLEEFAEKIAAMGGQGVQNPQQQAVQQRMAIEMQKANIALQERQIAMEQQQQKHAADMEKMQADLAKAMAEIEAKRIELEGKIIDRDREQVAALSGTDDS